MCRLIESICLLDGKLRNLKYHHRRMNQTRYQLFGAIDKINLGAFIKPSPKEQKGKYKCRVLYGERIDEVQILPYEIKPIEAFQLVTDNHIDYGFKYENRKAFEDLKQKAQKEIIIVKNGTVTDTSFSNLAFFSGKKWYTPSAYLLNGTMRQYLLETQALIETDITPETLNNYSGFKLINAMMTLKESPWYEIDKIEVF